MISFKGKDNVTHLFTMEQLRLNGTDKAFADALYNLSTMKVTWNPKTWLRYASEYRKAIRACRK